MEINISEINTDIDKLEFISSFIENDSIDITFLYLSDFKNTKIIRDFVVALMDAFNFSKQWKNRFVLIADELNNNAIEYGSTEGDINKIRLVINGTEDTYNVTIEVLDSGNGENSKTSDEMNTLKEEKIINGFKNHRGIRGRGLFQIIYNLVDDLYFKNCNDSSGLMVGIEKKIKKDIS